MTDFPGIDQTLGKYRIISILGKGSTATVFKASHKFLNVYVALKVLAPELIKKDPGIRERFLDEATNHARLNHSNFVRIIDVEDDPVYTYMVMEYIDGSSLEEILKKEGVLPVLQVLDIFIQVCRGLQYALELNIIHRDIKPGNIIITRDSEVKLVDFGLAKQVNEPDKHQKIKGQIFGTPYYMSPEQFIDSATVDHRSDLYSLGAAIYHIATGKLPFATDNIAEIIEMHLKKAPIPPAVLNPVISKEFSVIIMKLLEKNPEDRYQDYSSLLRHLEILERLYHSQKPLPETKTPENAYLVQSSEFNPGVGENEIKPDIESYLSQSVKNSINNIGKDENETVVSDRLQKKYQKYFRQFNQGAELENAIMNNLNQGFSDSGFSFAANAENTRAPEESNVKSEKLSVKEEQELSRHFNQSFADFTRQNQVKISAAKYIQKFKKLFA